MNLSDCLRLNRTYVIAEMSANHGGSYEQALEIVRAASEAGADCFKTQTYTADTMTLDCDNEHFRIQGGLWESYRTRHALYRQAYTPWEWQPALKQECEQLGLDFLSSVFDATSVDFLEGIGVGAYKIASCEIVDLPLLKHVASKGKPVIMSTGIALIEEIREAITAVEGAGNRNIVLLKCTSEYPAPLDDMNLATIPDMARQFGYPVGLSDHSPGWVAAVAGVALGARVIEKHFCVSRDRQTADSSFSMDLAEFRQMTEAIRLAEQAIGKPSYELPARSRSARNSRRSLFASADIRAGEVFSPSNIRSVRPGAGLHTRYYEQLLGKASKRNLRRGEPLTDEDL